MNNKKKINLLVVGCLLVALIAAVFTVGCPTPPETTAPPTETTAPPTETTTPPPAEEHLAVGLVMPLSGPISTVGLAWVRGYELYFDRLNEEGGVQIGNTTYLVDLVVEDSKSDPEAAATAAQKVILQDGAKFVFGAILDQATETIYSACASNGALHLVPWVGAEKLPNDVSADKPLAIRPMISPYDSNIPLLDTLLETYPDTKTVTIAVPNYGPFSEIMMETAVRPAVADHGLEILSEEIWDWGTTDFIPLFTKLLAPEPDAVISLLSGQAHYHLMAARQLGFTGPFVNTSVLGPDVFLAVAGPEACTDLICAGWDPAGAEGVLKEIVDRWDAKYGPEPFISDAAFAYEEGWIFAQVLEAAQSVDPETVMATFETLTAPGSLQSPFGPARAAGVSTYGVNRVLERPVAVSYLMDGQVVYTKFVPIDVD